MPVEGLKRYLERPCPVCGPEKETRLAEDVILLRSPFGSYRFMALNLAGRAVAVLQVVSDDGRRGVLSNAYAVPEVRGTAIVPRLLRFARKRFEIRLVGGEGGAGTAAGTFPRLKRKRPSRLKTGS